MNVERALQRLSKWRSVFAGWQLGTRPIGDPECDAVRDHRELSMMLRAELTAMSRLLIAKGVCTREEFAECLGEEAVLLDKDYQARFPGITATDDGITIDERAAETTKGWRP